MTEKRAAEMDLGVEVSKGLIAKFLMAAFGFFGTIIFARVLGPTDFGGYYLLLSLVELSKRPIDGLVGASQKRFAESGTPRREILGAQTILTLGLVALASVIVFAFKPYLESYTGLAGAALFFVVLFGSKTLFNSFQKFLASIGDIGVQTWIDFARSILTLALQLVLVLLGYGAAGMAFGLSLGTVLLLPITHHYLRVIPKVPTRETLQSIWSFARYSIPSTFVGKAYDRFDVLLLGALATPAIAGHYEVAFKLTVPTMFVTSVATSGMMAKVSDLDSQGKAVAKEISNTMAFSSLFAIPTFFGALSIANSLVVTTYGPSYSAATILVVGLGFYRIVQTQTEVLFAATAGLDRPEWQLWASTAALAINIPLGIVLYLQTGSIGVVVATIIADGLRYVLLSRVVLRETEISSLIPGALLEQTLAGLVMFVVVEVLSTNFPILSWWRLLVVLAIGVGTYFSVLVVVSDRFRGTAYRIALRSASSLGLR